jgi:hypothetical protein
VDTACRAGRGVVAAERKFATGAVRAGGGPGPSAVISNASSSHPRSRAGSDGKLGGDQQSQSLLGRVRFRTLLTTEVDALVVSEPGPVGSLESFELLESWRRGVEGAGRDLGERLGLFFLDFGRQCARRAAGSFDATRSAGSWEPSSRSTVSRGKNRCPRACCRARRASSTSRSCLFALTAAS